MTESEQRIVAAMAHGIDMGESAKPAARGRIIKQRRAGEAPRPVVRGQAGPERNEREGARPLEAQGTGFPCHHQHRFMLHQQGT